jgi:DNA-binding CsgD family transcriptional regulator
MGSDIEALLLSSIRRWRLDPEGIRPVRREPIASPDCSGRKRGVAHERASGASIRVIAERLGIGRMTDIRSPSR